MQIANGDLAKAVASVINGINDPIAIMASIASLIYHHDDRFDWVGFYRHIAPETLLIGPYQGNLGCLTIPFSRGVCGACAREKKPILVPNVYEFEGHIACASSTQSELVLPVLNANGDLLAVFDIDSNQKNAFTQDDITILMPILSISFIHFQLGSFKQ